jgi:hypothetical protein
VSTGVSGIKASTISLPLSEQILSPTLVKRVVLQPAVLNYNHQDSLQLIQQLSAQPKENKPVANVVIGKIEVALEDVAHWLAKAQTVLLKGPAIIASLGTLFVAVDKVLSDASTDLSNPVGLINIPMDVQQFADLKLVWTDIKAAFASAGVKI